tara:strand:- start:39 stop:533 length:495 start_codon:yes stop_codon:yes gene_type:complete
MHPLLGKPMLKFAIDYAKQSKKISKIYVSTDDEKIAMFSGNHGVEVITRPVTLCGETPLIDVYRHTLDIIGLRNVKTVVGIQADHPDRNISLDNALSIYLDKHLDRLYSKGSNGTINGAVYIASANGIRKGHFEKEHFIIDDCTNIHYFSDLLLAEERLRTRTS